MSKQDHINDLVRAIGTIAYACGEFEGYHKKKNQYLENELAYLKDRLETLKGKDL